MHPTQISSNPTRNTDHKNQAVNNSTPESKPKLQEPPSSFNTGSYTLYVLTHSPTSIKVENESNEEDKVTGDKIKHNSKNEERETNEDRQKLIVKQERNEEILEWTHGENEEERRINEEERRINEEERRINEEEIRVKEEEIRVKEEKRIKEEIDSTYEDFPIKLEYHPINAEENLNEEKTTSLEDNSLQKTAIFSLNEANEEQVINCPHCPKTFENFYKLFFHLRLLKKNVKCKLCSSQFDSREELLKHAPVHFPAENCLCNKCNQSFTSKLSMVAHACGRNRKRNNSIINKPFSCTVCSKSFVLPYYFKLHMKSHVSNENVYCERCFKPFPNTISLNLHRGKCLQKKEEEMSVKKSTLIKQFEQWTEKSVKEAEIKGKMLQEKAVRKSNTERDRKKEEEARDFVQKYDKWVEENRKARLKIGDVEVSCEEVSGEEEKKEEEERGGSDNGNVRLKFENWIESCVTKALQGTLLPRNNEEKRGEDIQWISSPEVAEEDAVSKEESSESVLKEETITRRNEEHVESTQESFNEESVTEESIVGEGQSYEEWVKELMEGKEAKIEDVSGERNRSKLEDQLFVEVKEERMEETEESYGVEFEGEIKKEMIKEELIEEEESVLQGKSGKIERHQLEEELSSFEKSFEEVGADKLVVEEKRLKTKQKGTDEQKNCKKIGGQREEKEERSSAKAKSEVNNISNEFQKWIATCLRKAQQETVLQRSNEEKCCEVIEVISSSEEEEVATYARDMLLKSVKEERVIGKEEERLTGKEVQFEDFAKAEESCEVKFEEKVSEDVIKENGAEKFDIKKRCEESFVGVIKEEMIGREERNRKKTYERRLVKDKNKDKLEEEQCLYEEIKIKSMEEMMKRTKSYEETIKRVIKQQHIEETVVQNKKQFFSEDIIEDNVAEMKIRKKSCDESVIKKAQTEKERKINEGTNKKEIRKDVSSEEIVEHKKCENKPLVPLGKESVKVITVVKRNEKEEGLVERVLKKRNEQRNSNKLQKQNFSIRTVQKGKVKEEQRSCEDVFSKSTEEVNVDRKKQSEAIISIYEEWVEEVLEEAEELNVQEEMKSEEENNDDNWEFEEKIDIESSEDETWEYRKEENIKDEKKRKQSETLMCSNKESVKKRVKRAEELGRDEEDEDVNANEQSLFEEVIDKYEEWVKERVSKANAQRKIEGEISEVDDEDSFEQVIVSNSEDESLESSDEESAEKIKRKNCERVIRKYQEWVKKRIKDARFQGRILQTRNMAETGDDEEEEYDEREKDRDELRNGETENNNFSELDESMDEESVEETDKSKYEEWFKERIRGAVILRSIPQDKSRNQTNEEVIEVDVCENECLKSVGNEMGGGVDNENTAMYEDVEWIELAEEQDNLSIGEEMMDQSGLLEHVEDENFEAKEESDRLNMQVRKYEVWIEQPDETESVDEEMM